MAFPIAAALAVAGSLGASALSWWNQRRSERWQENLANSAVQRRMADLRAAGINPILAGRDGAPVPSVAPVRFENPLDSLPDDVATAQRVRNENALVEEQRAKLKADTKVSEKTLEVMDVGMAKTVIDNARTIAETALTNARVPREEMWAQVFRVIGNTLSKYVGSREKSADLESAFGRLLETLGVKKGEQASETLWELYQVWKYGDWKDAGSSHEKGLKGTMRREGAQGAEGSASGRW